jgi:hypothetical protein
MVSFTDITLVLTVPEGEVGTVSFVNSGDGVPALLTTGGTNPANAANDNSLSDVAGDDSYDTIAHFKPTGLTFPPSYPSQDGISDFILFSLGSFSNTESNLNDYNADDGTITPTSGTGEERRYSLNVTGFSSVHFDVYGLKVADTGKGIWTKNPNSHDSTWTPPDEIPPGQTLIPEPSSALLIGLGLAGWGWRRRRRVL